MSKGFRYCLIALLGVAVLAAAHVAFWSRYMVEKDYRQVEITLNYDEINSLAGIKGLTATEGLREFKEHGIAGVVLREPMLDDLRLAGDILVYSGKEILNQENIKNLTWFGKLTEKAKINGQNTYIVTTNKDIFQQVAAQMSAKLAKVAAYELGDTYVIETPAPYIAINTLGVGFAKASLGDIEKASMGTVLQIRTWPGATQKSIERAFELYRQIPNVTAVMFNDDTLPGYPSLLPILADQIRRMNVPLVQVEFFPQRGFEKVGILLDKNVVRLHTVAQNELKTITSGEALDRYVLAAAERNHRILLVRPFLTGGDLLQENLNFMDILTDRLRSENLIIGKADQLPPVPVSKALVFLTGLGVIAGGLLLLDKLKLNRIVLPSGIGAVVFWAAILLFDFTLARKLMALASVIVFPSLSLVSNIKTEGLSSKAAVVTFIRLSLFSLLGALFMVGLLADAGFMMKLDQFAGVKLAHVVPLVIVLLYFILLTSRGVGLQEKLKGIMSQPVLLGVALAGALMAVMLLIYVARTGNEGVSVSGLELQSRALLDKILGVRPRTKEFLLGHPAMLLLLIYGYRDNRFLPLLMLGAIGQASLVNTFAHIHTPLLISMIRAFHGLWLGVVLGLVIYFLIRLFKRQEGRFVEWLK